VSKQRSKSVWGKLRLPAKGWEVSKQRLKECRVKFESVNLIGIFCGGGLAYSSTVVFTNLLLVVACSLLLGVVIFSKKNIKKFRTILQIQHKSHSGPSFDLAIGTMRGLNSKFSWNGCGSRSFEESGTKNQSGRGSNYIIFINLLTSLPAPNSQLSTHFHFHLFVIHHES